MHDRYSTADDDDLLGFPTANSNNQHTAKGGGDVIDCVVGKEMMEIVIDSYTAQWRLIVRLDDSYRSVVATPSG